MSTWLIPVLSGAMAVIGTIGAAFIASRVTSRGQDNTAREAAEKREDDALNSAAKWWQEALAQTERRLGAEIDTLKESSDRQGVELETLRTQNIAYRNVIAEVITWLTDRMEWEGRGSPPPPPGVTIGMILAHLATALKGDPDGK